MSHHQCPECGAKPSAGWGGQKFGVVYHEPGCSIGADIEASQRRHPAGHGRDPEVVDPPKWASKEARKAYALDHMDDADDYYDERDVMKEWF